MDGPQGQFELIFGARSATIQGGNTYTTGGFSFDPLPGQADPSGLGENDRLYAFYDPVNCGACEFAPQFPSFTSFSVSAVPEPSTWIMMLLGFLGLAYTVGRRKRNGSRPVRNLDYRARASLVAASALTIVKHIVGTRRRVVQFAAFA